MTFQKAPPEAGAIIEEPAKKFGEPDEAFLKEWSARRTSPVPDRVLQEETHLGIDDELKSRIDAPRGPRILPHRVDNLFRVGRRILEEAINEAVSQEELHPRQSEWEPKWSLIADRSQDAFEALEELFRAIDPHGKEAELTWSIRRSRAGGIEASKAGDHAAAAKSALRDARLLAEAKQIIGKLHADTLASRAALVAIYPDSYQEHQKRGFVRILAEGWVFLTGKRPSKQRDPSKNAFLRVVEAAWTDWHGAKRGDTLAFGEALDAAIASIDEARLKELLERPEWADPRLMARWNVRL